MKTSNLVVGFVASNLLPSVFAAQPFWGCGLLGPVPGIQQDGTTDPRTQALVDALKATSSFGQVSYWNWNLAPMRNDDGSMQHLSKDFIFMPEQWGTDVVNPQYVREAGKPNFLDNEGQVCPATMGTIFLGANEPDIIGSCMGSMMGKCTGSCTAGEVASGCPISHLNGAPAEPLPNGHCDCWTDSHATGMGFWPVAGCSATQPLPELFKDPACVKIILDNWKQTAAIAVKQGYKYLTTPLLAVNMEWMRSFLTAACASCTSISCGCPTHVGWHFYANDCRPNATGGYANFQDKLQKTLQLMEDFPFLQGAIVNEVGMLNCAMDTPDAECIPNGATQKYPAINQPDHACPVTDELPDGLATFVTELVRRARQMVTKDGRKVITGFSWFNENMAGGTYNLQLFNPDGSVNSVGQAYMAACKGWAEEAL